LVILVKSIGRFDLFHNMHHQRVRPFDDATFIQLLNVMALRIICWSRTWFRRTV